VAAVSYVLPLRSADLVQAQRKPTSTKELTSASLPAGYERELLGLRLRQPVALVLDVHGDLGQRLGVLAAVVRAEKQLSRVRE
jgi:hypothetical protein